MTFSKLRDRLLQAYPLLRVRSQLSKGEDMIANKSINLYGFIGLHSLIHLLLSLLFAPNASALTAAAQQAVA